MLEVGIDEYDVYIYNQSGKECERPKYDALKSILKQGDLVYINFINAIGRNYSIINVS